MSEAADLVPLLHRREDRSLRERIEQDMREWNDVLDKRVRQSFGGRDNPQAVAQESSPRLPDGCILTAASHCLDDGVAVHHICRRELVGEPIPCCYQVVACGVWRRLR
ncbi:hypothetical protein [Streptomyces sp. SID3343]|uniref:hypothetical protein n=1 Tax=Streptomyces sp. SID3343 TaxID=2690260 RepID=UPI00136E7351|nr:hypothetical protein [Streptomyces sp. SID3343]